LSVFLLPAGERKQGSIDFAGAGLMGTSLAMLMLGLTFLGYGSAAHWSWPLFVTSLALAVLLLRHEHKVSDPILDLDILKRKPFVAANLYNLIYGGAVVGVLSLIPTYATALYNMTPSECGLLLTPRSVGMIIASVLTSIYIMEWGYRWPLIIGNTATVAGLYLLGLEPAGVLFLYVIMFLLGVGVGVLSPTANNACIELLPDRAATITGIRGMFRQMGGALSVTIATLVVETVGDPSKGFAIVFFGLAIAFVAAMPLIFMMPSRPGAGVERSRHPLRRQEATAKERAQ